MSASSRYMLVLVAALALWPESDLSGARAEADAPPVPASPAASDEQRFDPASVRLDATAPESAMLQALADGDKPKALKLGEEALPGADAASRGRLLWLLARIEPDADASQEHFASLMQSEHPLARWAGLRFAERTRARAAPSAVNVLRGLDEGWAGAGEASLQLALALQATGNATAAEPRLRALLAQVAPTAPAPALALGLAELLDKRRTPEALREALALCRRVTSRAVAGIGVQRAEQLASNILGHMSQKQRALLQTPSADEELARGQAFMNAHHYDEAQRVLDRVAPRFKHDPEHQCQAELLAGHTLLFRKQHAQAAKRLRAAAERCHDADTKAWARYYAGTAYARSGDPKSAAAQYAALVREQPSNSLADDALLMQAMAEIDAGDRDAMHKTLEELLTQYPKGDMRAEARYALAFDARAHGDHAAALEQLERLIAEGAPEQGEGFEGRAAYWRARTLQALGNVGEAKTAFLDVARAAPLSYHGQQALARLAELDPLLSASALAELAQPGAAEPALRFAWRSELDSSAWHAAIELLRVGEVDLAQQEFAWLGAGSAKADSEFSWLVAATLHEARAYAEASQLARSRLHAFHATLPTGRARLLWRIAYPRAYEPLIEQAAQEAGVPAEFVRGVAREESSFNPNSVSTALAYGLIQLIRPTARTYARALKLPSDPAALKRPDVNLRIGAQYIKALWQRYPQNPAVVPAAYNAGEAAADKWLRERASQPLDEWIEAIPYRETRRYTRRVLQSYGIYAWLDTGKLPPLPAALPPAPAL